MATNPLLSAAASATAGFAALAVDTQAYAQVVIASDPLTTDTIAVKVVLPSGNNVAYQVNGTAVSLSSGKEAVLLPGGPTYTFTKSATTDTVNLWLTPVGRSNG